METLAEPASDAVLRLQNAGWETIFTRCLDVL
jgi:hypothetical protein